MVKRGVFLVGLPANTTAVDGIMHTKLQGNGRFIDQLFAQGSD